MVSVHDLAALRHELGGQRGRLVATYERTVVLVLRRPPHPEEVLVT